jgi:exosome complex RNA-binding protein Csl4
MPLVRARCSACSLPLGDPPLSTLAVSCNRCGRAAAVRVAADGQPADFDPAFGPARLMGWLASARVAMASGAPGIALGACAGCGSPLVVSSREPVSLPCPHCGEAVQGSGAERLVDQWTEPWAKVEGGGLELEYRLAVVEDRTGLSAGCAVCGGPTPTGDSSMACRRCGAVTWVERGGGRMQLGVRVDGVRDKRPFEGLVSIAQGEALLRADAMRGTAGSSGGSLLRATGIGCAAAVAVAVLLGMGIAIVAHFGHC